MSFTQAERRALESKHEFDHVTKLLKSELARFEQERIEDFKNSLHAFLEGMIARQKEVWRSLTTLPTGQLLKARIAHWCLGELSADALEEDGRWERSAAEPERPRSCYLLACLNVCFYNANEIFIACRIHANAIRIEPQESFHIFL